MRDPFTCDVRKCLDYMFISLYVHPPSVTVTLGTPPPPALSTENVICGWSLSSTARVTDCKLSVQKHQFHSELMQRHQHGVFPPLCPYPSAGYALSYKTLFLKFARRFSSIFPALFHAAKFICHLLFTCCNQLFLSLRRYFPQVIQDHLDQNLLTFLLATVCSPHYFNNPYLVSKVSATTKLRNSKWAFDEYIQGFSVSTVHPGYKVYCFGRSCPL